MSGNELSDEQKKTILKLARDTITRYAASGKKVKIPEDLPDYLKTNSGAFVTLHKEDMLRGCIGTFIGEGDLYSTIINMAVCAGWKDPRFPSLEEKEIELLEIEVSVLSPLREIKDINEIGIGKHGIYITGDYSSGVLLPQVATEYGWDTETFLENTCLKARLSPDAWQSKNVRIDIFSAQVFRETTN
jgi:uncharacterized protein